jgi:hypothetical protein
VTKKVLIEDFIGIYDGYFSDEFCDNLIEYFEWCQRNNRTFARPEAERIKNDDSVGLNPVTIQEINFMWPNIQGYMSEFNQVFWDECYADYSGRFSVLQDYGPTTIYTYKLQKTIPGGGYHIWHSEDGVTLMSRRTGVYILYLNDVDEGGETEFLYQTRRVPAKKGRLVIFPPNYPWAHRGNPPLSGVKYILTGWMEFK